MRTTLDKDRLRAYRRSKAKVSSSKSLSHAVAELVKSALNSRVRTRIVNGLQVVGLPPGGEVVTAERVRNPEPNLKFT